MYIQTYISYFGSLNNSSVRKISEPMSGFYIFKSP